MLEKVQAKGAQSLADLTANITADKFPLPEDYKPSGPPCNKAPFSTVRRAEYRGKEIRVRTTYDIEIDGEPLMVHTMVMDDGTIRCHGLPNYAFQSALDMARALIDAEGLAIVDVDELGDGTGESQSHGGHQ